VAAHRAGVDLIGLDIERIGICARQGHLPHLRISDHELHRLPALRQSLTRARAFVRCNSLHEGSRDEIERAVASGAQVLMLPFFQSAREVETFVRFVDRRAEVSLLVETPGAVGAIDDIVAVSGVDEVMVGLNDLHLALGLANQFELVVSPVMARIADAVHHAGVPFGFGGLADPAHRSLPIPPPVVYAQYPRLRASGAFIARKFRPGGLEADDLAAAIERCRSELDAWSASDVHRLAAAQQELAEAAKDVGPISVAAQGPGQSGAGT
jgi:hypothetical protein